MGKQDALESAKIGTDGEVVQKSKIKEQASAAVKAAREALPSGVQANSPFVEWSRDQMLAEASRSDIVFAALLETDDLRFVLEHHRQVKIATTPVANTPVGGKPRVPSPPVPPPAPKRPPVRGLPPSPTNTWKVEITNSRDGQPQRTLSIGGQMVTLRTGAIIEARHYEPYQLQAMVDQGIKLVPLTQAELDESKVQ